MNFLWTRFEREMPAKTRDQPSDDDEQDTTRNGVPLTVLIISVPFMLGVFVLIGYLIYEWNR